MTLKASQYAAGVRILGIGDADNNTFSATVWATRGAQRLITSLTLSLWRADCLVELPQTVERRVDPWASRYETGPMSFELDLDAVGDIIPVQGWEPVALTSILLTAGNADVRLSSGDLAGQTVYIGDETIKLSPFVFDLGGGVWQYGSSTRGYHGARAHEHAAGEPVFLSPPSWLGRTVQLLVVRGDDAGLQPRVRWSGFISGITTSATGTRVVIEGKEILDGLIGRQLGLGSPDLNAGGGALVDLFTQARLSGQLPFTSLVRKPWTAPRKVCIQIGASVWVVNQTTPGILDLALATLAYGELDINVEPLKDENFGAMAPLNMPIYELLVISKELDDRFGDVSVTSQLTAAQRYNPLAAAFAILTSTNAATELVDPLELDIFGEAWGLPLYEWLDVETWAAQIDVTPEIQMDQLYEGTDGEPTDAIELIVDVLLRPYGFFLTITEEGQLGVARLISPTIRDLCEGADRQLPIVRPSSGGQLGWSWEVGSAVGAVTALVGAVPWASEPSSITVRTGGRTPRSAMLTDSAIYTYDLRTVARSRVASSLDADGGDAVSVRLIDRAIRASWALPRLMITALDSRAVGASVRYDLGAFVSLAAVPPAPIFRLPDGSRADLADPDQQVYFLGQILGARQNIPNQTWELELLLLAWRTGKVARFRAPSAVVEAASGSELEIFAASEFGGSTSDAVGFAAGDEITFWGRDGTDLGEPGRTVVAFAPSTSLILDDATTEGMNSAVVRLAPSTVYSNTGSAADVECSDRPWVYLADADDEIGRPAAAVEGADIYG